ncbi:hypothetical protein BYT27DRAFT_7218939 [Phlegmacium glaucopus]|nr:hypothetical protein BYT27DRAFT_7218939 [Phlegmacium glaucopus]
MGPEDTSDVNPASSQGLTIPKLQSNGSNWTTYAERVMNYLTSKGLRRHVTGTVRKPIQLVERVGEHYFPGLLAPLNEEELEKHEVEQDEYDQKQASVREIIYRTIDNSTFIQVKNEIDAVAVWKKIASIHTDKGTILYSNIVILGTKFPVPNHNVKRNCTRIWKEIVEYEPYLAPQ